MELMMYIDMRNVIFFLLVLQRLAASPRQSLFIWR